MEISLFQVEKENSKETNVTAKFEWKNGQVEKQRFVFHFQEQGHLTLCLLQIKTNVSSSFNCFFLKCVF